MTPMTDRGAGGALAARLESAAAEVADKLSTFLTGAPPDARETAIGVYRQVTLELLAQRGLPPDQAEPLVDTIIDGIRSRLAIVDRAGGSVAGRA